MAIKLSQIGAKTRTVTMEYEGEPVALVYRPGKFTPRIEARLNEAQSEGRVSQEVAAVLADVLASWDVLGDDGKPVKPTTELLMEFPVDFLNLVSQAVAGDMRPKEPSA